MSSVTRGEYIPAVAGNVPKMANVIDGIPGKCNLKLGGCDNINLNEPTFIFSLCICQFVSKVPRSMALENFEQILSLWFQPCSPIATTSNGT